MRYENRHKGLFFCLLALLIWLPWPLGGNRPWAWPVMSSAALILLSFWLLSWLRKPYRLPSAVKNAKVPLFLMGLWLFYLLLQIVPIPESLLMMMSPSSASAYNGLELASVYSSISVDRASTFSALIKSSTYVALFFLVLVLVKDQRRLKTLIWVIIGTAVVEVIYGMMSVGTVMMYVKAAHHTVSGSYPNRNHFAGFMEMALSLGIGLFMIRYFGGNFSSTWRAKVRTFLDSIMGSQGITVIIIAILLIGLMLSASRGGFIAFTISFVSILAFALTAKGSKLAKDSKLKGDGIVLKLLVFVVFVAIALNSSEVFLRLTGGGVSGREFVWEPGLIMAKDYALFGSGLGTFQSAFPFYYPSLSQTWWHAHMDYFELFIEQGAIGFILFGSSTIAVLVIVFRSYLKRRNAFALGVLFGVLVGTISILIHETIDYHFYIPANAAYFYVLLAIGVVAASLRRRNRV